MLPAELARAGSVPATNAVPHAGGRRARLLLLWDLLIIWVAFAVTEPLPGLGLSPDGVGFPGQQSSPGLGPFDPPALVFAILAVVGLALTTERGAGLGGRFALLLRLGAVAAVSVWITVIIAAAAGWAMDLDQLILISLALPPAWLVGRILLSSRRRQRVLLIGSGRIAAHVTALCGRHPESRFDVIGCLDDHPRPTDEGGAPLLGSLGELNGLLAAGGVDRVVVCFSDAGDRQIADALRACDEHHVELDMVPRMFDLIGPSPRTSSIGGFPLVSLTAGGSRSVQMAAKRAFDIVFASGLLLLLLPMMAVCALAIVLDSRGPVFYRSTRLGRQGRPFRMLKFRTMVVGADAMAVEEAAASLISGALKPRDDARVTRVGKVLRRVSADELPQLLNVLGGSMSVVGPRPVLESEAFGVEGWATRRHNVRPGVTGLWQVLGRGNIPWAERMQLDYAYARHWSLTFDLRILASTLAVVVSRKGAY